MAPECQALLQSLERATARVATLAPGDFDQIEQNLALRSRAIEALADWIAAEQLASRPVDPELLSHLTKDLESGAASLVQIVLHREAIRADLLSLGRELQVLHGLSFAALRKPSLIDCQG